MTTKEVTFRRYTVREDKALGNWGIFVIGSDGYFSVVSDWGNYAFFWGHTGEDDFRKFLISLHWDYLAGKLTPGQKGPFNVEKTVENIKDHICQHRRDGSWSKTKARTEWDACALVAEEMDPHAWMAETDIQDAYELLIRDRHPHDVTMFTKKVYPLFIEALKKELAA